MNHRGERFEHLVLDLHVQHVSLVNPEPLEHQPVELGALPSIRASIELVRVVKVDQHLASRSAAALYLLGGLVQGRLEPGFLVANLAHLLRQLLPRPVWIRCQFDVAIFLAIKVRKTSLETGFSRLVPTTLIRNRFIDSFDEFAAQRRLDPYGVVVTRDGLFQLDGPDIGQVAEPVLAAAADVVEVKVTGFALAARDDHAPVAATAEQHPL